MSGYESAEFSTDAPVLVEVRCGHGRPVAWVYEGPDGALHIHASFNEGGRSAGGRDLRNALDHGDQDPRLMRGLAALGLGEPDAGIGVQRDWLDGALDDRSLGPIVAGCADCPAQRIDRSKLVGRARSAAAGRSSKPLPRKTQLRDVALEQS